MPIWNYLLPDTASAWLWLPVTVVAQNAFTGLVIQVTGMLKPDTDYQQEFLDIPWVDGIFRLRRPYLILVGSAFFEEAFFRWAVLFTMIEVFPDLDTLFVVGFVTFVFTLQQVGQLRNGRQAHLLVNGSFAVSFFGCALALLTGSALLSAICHASFALMYVKTSANSRDMDLQEYFRARHEQEAAERDKV